MYLAGLVLLAALVPPPQNGDVDQKKLEYIRNLSSEQRARLKARLARIKQLPSAERKRLQDNLKRIKAMKPAEVKRLRERASRLSLDERKEYAELSRGFFKWAHQRRYLEGFPRGTFFHWLKNDRPEIVEQIRAMEAGIGSPRVDAFLKLYYEFRNVMQGRITNHVRRHACSFPEELDGLNDTSPKEFWRAFQKLQRACQSKRSRPGPVPPQFNERRKPSEAPRKR